MERGVYSDVSGRGGGRVGVERIVVIFNILRIRHMRFMCFFFVCF